MALVLGLRQVAVAAPGDPFGGDDSGCIPETSLIKIETAVTKAITKYLASVLKCHIKAAYPPQGSPWRRPQEES